MKISRAEILIQCRSFIRVLKHSSCSRTCVLGDTDYLNVIFILRF